MVKVLLKDRFYIQRDAVDITRVRELYEIRYATKQFCRPQCPLAMKIGRYCSTCPSSDAKVKTWEALTTRAGRRLVALPAGSFSTLKQVVRGRIDLIDKRPRIPFRSQLRWTGRLRRKGDTDDKGRPLADQLGMVRAWLKHVNKGHVGGLVRSPPRSGKCVTGDTLIRTDKGLVRIDSLFTDYAYDIEIIGRFGYVATPYGAREIRGLYSKVVDRTIEILLASGLRLCGSVNHPVLVLHNRKCEWRELQNVKGDEQVVLPRSSLDSLQNIARTALRYSQIVGDHYAVEVAPRMADAIHLTLIGSGVRATLIKCNAATTIYVPVGDAATEFLNERVVPALVHSAYGVEPPPAYMLDDILSVRLVNEPRRVFDLMVPDVKCFTANGIAVHNTVIGVAGVLQPRERTLIVASKIDFLRQFGRRFGENTNLKQITTNRKHPVVLIDPKGWPDGPRYGVLVAKKWGQEAEKADIVLSCYQQLIGDYGAKKLRRYINGKFSTLVCDEAHQVAADCFLKLVNRFNARRKLALTATRERKDGLHPVLDLVFGPVVAQGSAVSTLPRLELFETGVHSRRKYSTWNGIVKFLSENVQRNKLIVRQVFKDLRSHKRACILVPVVRISHVHMLVKLINEQAAYNRQSKNENWPTELAVAYYGKSDTNSVLNQVAAGRARVVIANTSMVQHALDVHRWSHVYIGCVPTSNTPKTYQLINRICTPYTEKMEQKLGPKPQPIARFMIDALDASIYCFRKIFNEKQFGILSGINGTNVYGAKLYSVAPDVLQRMRDIASFPKSYRPPGKVRSLFGVSKYGKTYKTGSNASWSGSRPITKL